MNFEQHVFLSDVHLGAFPDTINKKIESDLIALINHCKEQKISLYILGDLFDYWMEYPHRDFVPDLGIKVLEACEEYNKAVKPILYITGNHDNWTFGHFEERGFDVEPNHRIIPIHNKRFLLLHGDGVASKEIDFSRAALHRLLRNDRFVRFYQRVLPPKTGLATMKVFSSITRKRNTLDPKPLNDRAEKLIGRHDLDYMISGHDHIPRMETFSNGNYINLGTYFKHRSVALYNNAEITLVKWQAKEKKFLPFEPIKHTI